MGLAVGFFAGLAGFTGWIGFLIYLVGFYLQSFFILLEHDKPLTTYFQSPRGLWLDGLTSGLFVTPSTDFQTYVISWTFFYNLAYVY